MGEGTEGETDAVQHLAELEAFHAAEVMTIAFALMTMQLAHSEMLSECRKAARWLWCLRVLLFTDAYCFAYDLARIEIEPFWGTATAALVGAGALYVLRHEHRHAATLKQMRLATAASGKQIKAFERKIANESGA